MKKRTKIVFISIGSLIVAIFTCLTIKILTIDTSMAVEIKYELPNFNNLEDIYEISGGEYAIAIDGNPVTVKENITTRPTASTAKMILGLAVMKKKPFDLSSSGKTIVVDQDMYDKYTYYVNNGGSNTVVNVGEEISQYDALASVFLASSNNMADSLAIWAFGSMDDYHTYATEMLSELGILNTTIGPDASGFDPGTTSTPEDLAKIGFYLLKDPVLKEIVGKKSHDVPVAGTLNNTNQLIGSNDIIGIKTGWIGDISGYCLVVGYMEGNHIITVALLNSPSRENSFSDTLNIVNKIQESIEEINTISTGDIVGYYDSWWAGKVAIKANSDLKLLGWGEAEKSTELIMNDDGETGILKITIADTVYEVSVAADDYNKEPSLAEKIWHLFGWSKEDNTTEIETDHDKEESPNDEEVDANFQEEQEESQTEEVVQRDSKQSSQPPFTNAVSSNCTIKYGNLMLINLNFTVEDSFIATRRNELVSISARYGIVEGNPYNGDNLLDEEAAVHINDMINDYKSTYPGHTMETRSCFRSVGTKCGRLCMATGTSDHHTGLTCDLLDPAYGTSLDTDTYEQHIEWQWLKENSYKYGFIDRFPVMWAGGPMSEPINVDENGSTGLFETWHYRYVGIQAATEIATGKYNNGEYDSLEHYLKARGLVNNLKAGTCE